MVNYIKSEFLKQKHRFNLKLLWLSPFIVVALVIILMGGRYFMEGAYNWWYTMILPGTLSMIVAFTVSAEKKHNRHGLFAVSTNKKKLWISQFVMNTILLLITNLIFFIVISIVGTILGVSIPFLNSFLASFVLFLTFAWQIPLFMYISEKMGSFFSIILSLFCNMGFGIFFAATRLWYVPFAIPARLMCPIIKVLPNGLPLEAGNHLGDTSVIFIGIMITVALYFIFSLITTAWFNHREVK
jgi:lantibiotic transport system permease protein